MSLQTIEKKWQKEWDKAKLGEAEPDKRKKFFMIFAYPGISGFLHVGHMRGFSYTDAICRYKRMNGYNVLFPVGTHASGNQAIAFANKVKNKDKDWLNYLKNNGCPEKVIKTLVDSDKVVDFFNKVYVDEYWKKFGFLFDKRRFTCTVYEDYNKFIQWQFKKLYDLDLLTQKPYFATACIEHGPVAVDPSETDISQGGNAEKMEYTLLKFKIGGDYLVAATLRPETVFGQTNLWVNPNTDYVFAEINGENWILSSEGAEKLAYQKDSVKVSNKKIKGKDLIGKFAKAPGLEKEIIILPAEFCDPKVGTGIVTCVPSDAPWDYIALKDLQNDNKLIKKYNLDSKVVKGIKLIPIIKAKDYGDYPAEELVKKFGIKSQKDAEKLEEATKEAYKAGFHTGIMSSNAGKYAGKRVEEAKELVKTDLISSKKADVLHDLSEEVICRCGEKVIIKRIDDQWFIRYSDSELTKKSKHCAEQMSVLPEQYKANLPSILDWFSDRACARLGNWMGTRLPFDERWIVEPISDSTLYPIYYLISKYVNEKKLKSKDLTEEFFDYVFLKKGKGNKLWDQIRKDVEYWYPLDINLGGKEHQTVHFPVFIMNHVAILPEKMWPKGIFVNWWVTGKGTKISKSKGGAEPIPGAIEKYGVDGLRLYYTHIGSPHVDVVWEEEKVRSYSNMAKTILNLASNLKKSKVNKELDSWLMSRMNDYVYNVTKAFESVNLREAANAYYDISADINWYIKRGGSNLKEALAIYAQLITPIMPHVAEEVWSKTGGKGLVSVANWPKHNEKKIDLGLEAGENSIKKIMDDVRYLVTKVSKPKKVTLFVSESWKYDLFSALKKQLGITRNVGEIIRALMKDSKLAKYGGEVSKAVIFAVKNPTRIPEIVLDQKKEVKLFSDAANFLGEEFGVKVEVEKAEDSKEEKAKQGIPGKPAILII
ncbi:MAG: leucine--tRNA ligase [Candidatus Nanoarchaeia archaeon]|nr:leucine--tRNA ligase [Candidatus Nanoarchaeia archaeon]